MLGPAPLAPTRGSKAPPPPVDGIVAPPAKIRLTFSEAVEPKFSALTLSGPGGAVPLGRAGVAPGGYTVKWRAVSLDSHQTQGDFDFTVK